MNAPLPIRTKLIVAGLMLWLFCAFCTLQGLGARSSGAVMLRLIALLVSGCVIFFGVFVSAQLQLLWGWVSAVAAMLLAALCTFEFHGPDLIFGLLAMGAVVASAYLLLMDSGVRDYRQSLKRKPAA